jgi:hypothetical protein
MESSPRYNRMFRFVSASWLAFLLGLLGGIQAVAAPSGPQGFNPYNALSRLDEAVPLTAEQKSKVLKIFETEAGALNAIPAADRPQKGAEFRQLAQAQLRALLDPEQLRKFDRTPQSQGGGLTMMSPENSVARLDKIVSLSNAQKKMAAEIFAEEIDELASLAPNERADKRTAIRQAAGAEVTMLLTPEQQQIMDANQHTVFSQSAEVRAKVASFLRTSSAIAARVGTVTRLVMVSSSDSSVNDGPPSSGTFSYTVIGKTKTETLEVYWKKPAPDSPANVVELTGSDGKIIQL